MFGLTRSDSWGGSGKACCLFRLLAVFCPVAFCLVGPASAQYRFDTWTADNGLPENIIRGICQTPDGYLWLATFDGLVRFDGVRFTVFNKTNSPGIRSNRFTSMYEDRDGDLWLGTEGSGVTRYHRGKFITYGEEQKVPGPTVRAITGDRSGNLWILSDDVIALWSEQTGKFVDIRPENLKIRYDSFRWENDGFWGRDETGLHCFINGRFVTYPLPGEFRGRTVWGAARDQDGTIWLEASDGKQASISPVQGKSKSATAYRDRQGQAWAFNVRSHLVRSVNNSSSGHVETISFSSVYEDREGNLWLATEGQGLYRLQKQSIRVYSKEQGLIDRNVYPIFQDHTGAVWIGAWPSGLSRFQNGKFLSFTAADDLPSKLVTALAEDRDGRLWVASHGGISVFAGGRFRKATGPRVPDRAVVQAIHQDREGTFWFGTNRGLVRFKDGVSTVFTPRDGLAAEDVRVIVESSSGGFWVGGYGGLTRLQNGKTQRWTEREGLPGNNIRSIYEDSDGVVWIGTYDAGLARLKAGKFTRYSMREGLYNNGVFQILEDAHGNFWMSCNRGIYRASKRELNEFARGARNAISSIPYTRIDGMANAECNGGLWPAGIKTREGELWFPTQDGVAVIDPASIHINPQAPPVAIESLMLDNVPGAVDRPLQITPDKKNLEIAYTALSFINSEQIRFRYRLESLDSDWVEAGPRREAYYSHLPPGEYVFRVIAGNRDGIWNNEGKSLSIIVLAPFYRRWWFEIAVLLCSATLVWGAWLYRVSQLQRMQAVQRRFSRQLIASQENERKRIAAELHDSLGQRLVVIKNLALFFMRAQGEAAKASGALRHVEEISAEAAMAIHETREIAYNLRPFQLDRLGLTKAIEGIVRSVSSASTIPFTSAIDNIDDAFAEELRIDFYRIVQESLNNIMKHSQATEASVSVLRGAGRVVLAIQDNGRGFKPGGRAAQAEKNGFGLTGMKERARLLGGDLTTRPAPGGGTIVRVEIHTGRDGRG